MARDRQDQLAVGGKLSKSFVPLTLLLALLWPLTAFSLQTYDPQLDGGACRWEVGMPLSPYNMLNVRSGRMLTALPVVGWGGRGPAVSFVLYHNMSSTYEPVPIEGGGEAPQGMSMVVLYETDEPRWRHSYSQSLELVENPLDPLHPSTVTVIHDTGARDVYTWRTLFGVYFGPNGVYDKLISEDDGQTYTGFNLIAKNQSVMHFTADGKLDYVADATEAVDGQGKPYNRIQCYYVSGGPAAGKLDHIQDAAGRVLQLHYNGDGRLCRIIDPVEREWRLIYDDTPYPEDLPTPEDLEADPQCETDVGKYFVALQDPADLRTHMGYTEDFDIQWIVDKTEISTYYFVYDGGRVDTVTDPLSLDQRFVYTGTLSGQAITRYYDRRNSLWTYTFLTTRLVLQSLENPLGQTQTWGYTLSGPRSREVTRYWNELGKQWEYGYDLRGNLTSVTLPTQEVWTLA